MDPENPYIGRIIVLLSPIFLGLAGWLVSWVADNLPGNPALDANEVGQLMIGAVVGVAALAYKWLDNRGKYEQGVQLTAAAQQVEAPPDIPPQVRTK